MYVKKITLDLNSDTLNEFYKISEILHKKYKENCFYNKSSAFQYILKNFNNDIKQNVLDKNKFNTYFNIQKEHKKNREIGICITDYIYNEFIKNCTRLQLKERVCIRMLMLKTIKEFNT